jgi:hypothetical protein
MAHTHARAHTQILVMIGANYARGGNERQPVDGATHGNARSSSRVSEVASF